jgi:hypothetical protein
MGMVQGEGRQGSLDRAYQVQENRIFKERASRKDISRMHVNSEEAYHCLAGYHNSRSSYMRPNAV